jgi:hypothetical protein
LRLPLFHADQINRLIVVDDMNEVQLRTAGPRQKACLPQLERVEKSVAATMFMAVGARMPRRIRRDRKSG